MVAMRGGKNSRHSRVDNPPPPRAHRYRSTHRGHVAPRVGTMSATMQVAGHFEVTMNHLSTVLILIVIASEAEIALRFHLQYGTTNPPSKSRRRNDSRLMAQSGSSEIQINSLRRSPQGRASDPVEVAAAFPVGNGQVEGLLFEPCETDVVIHHVAAERRAGQRAALH